MYFNATNPYRLGFVNHCLIISIILQVITNIYLMLTVCHVPGWVLSINTLIYSLQGFPGGSVGKESACNAGDAGVAGSIPGSGRSPGAGYGNPLQYSCLENPMDKGAWQATVHRVTKSQTQLKWLSAHTCMYCYYSHFINEETNIYIGQVVCLRSHGGTWAYKTGEQVFLSTSNRQL